MNIVVSTSIAETLPKAFVRAGGIMIELGSYKLKKTLT